MSQTKKQKLGQFYTTNNKYIMGNLLSIFPNDAIIVDPFAGEWDLLELVDGHTIEGYDIDPQNIQTIKQNTLLNPPKYGGKWVITNPPYLARNKNKDKTLYKKYNTDDLYKIALKTIIGCEGGAIVIPLNFFSSRDNKIREEFLSKYTIGGLNIFEEQVFEDTSYTVCSFSFKKIKNIKQNIKAQFFPSKQIKKFVIKKKYGYTIGSPFLDMINIDYNINIGRLVKGNNTSHKTTKLMLYAIDTGSNNGRIRLESEIKPYYGKISDRAFATIIMSRKISKKDQKIISEQFGKLLEKYRKKYHSLFLTNFRNSTAQYARKRIDFRLAYSIIKYIMYMNNI